ncbi:MFS transporter [Streptosporangium amethystogenes subsp. fukuiense]|uniref:MFS transporter n=1 Tax=Streptosporangium amethystogenes subsp. fukuiense TaxID=698418 RepID=A0ABW2T977_9ACTN
MPVPRSPWRAPVALAYATFVLAGLNAGVGGVLLPALIGDYGVDMTTIGITFFVSSAGFMLAGSGTGPLLERLGTRLALAIGGGLYVMATLYMASRPPFVAFLAVQLVAGYGIGVLESVLNAYLTELPSATTLLNRLHAFFGVGALLGPLTAAWMLTFLPWTAVWLVLAVACLPLVAGFLVAYPRHTPAGDGAAERPVPAGPPYPDALLPPADPEGSEPERGGLLTAVMRSPAVALASGFLAVYVGLEISVGNWGFTFLVEEHAQTGLTAGYISSGYWLGLTLGRFLISPVATRMGLTAVGMTYACLAGVTASAVLTWAAPGAAVATAGFLLLGFFLGPVFPTAMAVVPDLTTARLVPTAIGIMNGISVIGGAVLPWLTGAIGQSAGIWTLMPSAVLLALLQFALWRMIVARMTAERPDPVI